MADHRDISPYDVYTGPSSPESPGGFVFGPQGWTWGQPQVRSITFCVDGTCRVCDQHGRPIRGITIDREGQQRKEVLFATSSHAQVIVALEAERIDWRKLVCAGWPQLPLEELRKGGDVPAACVEALLGLDMESPKFREACRRPETRRAMAAARREYLDARAKEYEADEAVG